MSGITKPQEFINTILAEGIKSYVVYDGSDREIARYEAPVALSVGNNCIVTKMSYDGLTTKIVAMLETTGTWTQPMQDAVDAL